MAELVTIDEGLYYVIKFFDGIQIISDNWVIQDETLVYWPKLPLKCVIKILRTNKYLLLLQNGLNMRNKEYKENLTKPPPPNITRQERLALQDLNRDTDIIVLPADKGNTTVVINTSDYKKKMKNLLSDKAYKKLDKDPTNTIAQKTKTLVEESNIPSKTKSTLKPANSLPPRLYRLPKVHKPNIPFRPIVSAIHSPTYSLSRFLAQTLQPLTGKTESYITNSTDFIKKIQKIRLHPTDLLVSFDVESLFTQVPIKDTLNIIKASHKVPSDLIPLIEHCLTTTYFSYNNQFYEQTSGAAMGSPISPVIANIFMEHFEKEALGKTPKKPEVWFRYVDDTFVIWRHGRAELRKFLIFLNKQHPNIHFTMDIEENGKLPFLDVLVSKKADGTLGHQVYRKPTHTDRYLHAESHHHPAQKQSAINSLVHRAFTISDKEHLQTELNHLKLTLQKNGHDKKDITKVINKHANKTTVPDTQPDERILAFLPFVKGTTDRIGRILNKHNIRTIFKPPKKIGQILKNPKDQRPPLSSAGVYKIPCSCGQVYIGETGRMVNLRIKEHQRDVRLKHATQSALSEHNIETGHQIQFDKTTTIANIASYFPRKYREAIEIQKHPNNLNRDNDYNINKIWKIHHPPGY
ncbi:uncharacterized protein [Mycetomoellerius zeteki]|uniref:uncharacterized protein n=1 Tax=Mycetomoellerius zeteki TaxID=64791 RepID=UPI00084E4C4F|nr:PREDICTED: uncharacterized protein LOC108727783 [Trachymyrmex zeteki]